MKRLILLVLAAVLLAGCTTTGHNLIIEEEQELSLLEAINESVERLIAVIPAGSRLAIVAFESEHSNLSDFMKESLTGLFYNRGFEVTDWQNYDYIFRALNIDAAGTVSNDAARSVGRFLGAQFVITGQLILLNNVFQYRVNAIHTDRASHNTFVRLTALNDDETHQMITALAAGLDPVRTADYGVTEDTLPRTSGLLLDRGIMFSRLGNYEKAIADFTQVIQLNPNLSSGYVLRGRALYANALRVINVHITSDNDITEDDEQDFEEEQSEEPSGTQLAGFKTEAFEQAISDFTRAIRLDNHNAVLFRERGQVYSSKGDFERAITDFNQALRLNSAFFQVYNNRGSAYFSIRNFNRAIADFTQAIQFNPGYANAYFNRGSVYFEINDFDRAIADFETVLLINPNDEEALKWLEYARQRRGR